MEFFSFIFYAIQEKDCWGKLCLDLNKTYIAQFYEQSLNLNIVLSAAIDDYDQFAFFYGRQVLLWTLILNLAHLLLIWR